VRIGILGDLRLLPIERFRVKLHELGYVEGENLRIEYRFTEGRNERYPAMAAELVTLNVNVIVVWATPAALAAKQATSTIPIVAVMGDVLSTGLISNLAHPGGNITGFTSMNIELEDKRLELLKEIVPRLSRVGVLWNAANPVNHVTVARVRNVAETWGLAVNLIDVQNKDEVGDALIRLARARPDGVLVAPDIMLLTERKQIVAAMAANGLPAIYPHREYAEAGGLAVYGANISVLFQRAAVYVDKILKGTKPGDLPVQQATELELIINLGTATALGLPIAPSLLARADEVIE
jgi:putative ABC transport system substrate-binding protein